MDSPLAFSDAFTKDDLDTIVTKVEGLLLQAAPPNSPYYRKKFAESLCKLGIRSHYEDFIQQATQIIDDFSLSHQSAAYCRISDYYRQNIESIDVTQGHRYVNLAFKKWREALGSRDQNLEEDFFSDDLRLLETLHGYQLDNLYQECKTSVLGFIKSAPLNSQPLMFTRLAKRLLEFEDKSEILSFLESADAIVKNSSHTAARVLETNLEQSFPFYLSSQSPKTSFISGSSLFDFQLALAKASKDASRLRSLETAMEKMDMINDPTFSSIPRLLLGEAYYEIGSKNTALNIIDDVIQFLLSRRGEDQAEDLTIEQHFFPSIATRLSQICINLGEKDLAKRVVPLLKQERPATPLVSPGTQKLILIELNEYTEKDLEEEVSELKKKVGAFDFNGQKDLSPARGLPFLTSRRPPGFDLLMQFSELQTYATKLRADDIKEELFNLSLSFREKFAQKLEGKVPEKAMQEFFKGDRAQVSSHDIITAYNEENHPKVQSLLNEFEIKIQDLIKMISSQKDQIPPQHQIQKLPGGIIRFDPEVNRLLILTELADVYIKINRHEEANQILEEIQEYLNQNADQLKDSIKTVMPIPPIFQLFRRYAILRIQLGCLDEEIEDLIATAKDYDPGGLTVLGMTLAEQGNVDAASRIYNLVANGSQGVTSWNHYYREKAKILYELGERDKLKDLLELTFEGSKSDSERWRFDARQLTHCLFLEDREKIQETIEVGLKELSSPISRSPFSFVRPLVQDSPPLGVTREIWTFARNLLKEKLLELVANFNPQESVLRYRDLADVLRFLTKLNETDFVRNTLLKIVSTLQEAIRRLAPPDLINDIGFVSVDYSPWDFNQFLMLTISRSNLVFVSTRADYWDYYKSPDKTVEIYYDQFDSLYNRWFREYRAGNPNNLHLLLNVPYVYASLIDIFEDLEDDSLISLCQTNVDILRDTRLKGVQLESSSGKMDRTWYANLLTLIKTDLGALMAAQEYLLAKERFFQAFELLDKYEISVRDDLSDGLALNPLFLGILDMFEKLTK